MGELTALSAAAELAADDLLYMVDVSDTTDSADGTSKSIEAQAIGARFLIETITNGSAGEFDFNSIPAGFNRLILHGSLRGDAAVTSDGAEVYFNADTTAANYHYQAHLSFAGSAVTSEADTPFCMHLPGASAPANSYSNFTIVIEDYAGGNLKIARSNYTAYAAADNQHFGGVSVVSAITAAITRIRLRADGHAANQLLGTVRLYGEF